MKRIGIIGGMSWESTSDYYRRLNELAREQFGGLHSARVLIESLDFAEIAEMQKADDWAAAAIAMRESAERLVAGGAEAVLICSNTIHRSAKELALEIDVPLLHIADSVIAAAQSKGLRSIALLGTLFTMQSAFYREYLGEAGIEVVVPSNEDMLEVHRVIYEELCVGKFLDSSRQSYVEISERMISQGAEAVVLACTEIGLLLGEDEVSKPILDTSELHTRYAFKWSIS